MTYQSVQYGHMWGAPWFYGLNGGAAFFLILVTIIFFAALIALKGYALWNAATRKQIWWFIAILILNTAGILEAVYIVFFVKEWHKKSEHRSHHHGVHHEAK